MTLSAHRPLTYLLLFLALFAALYALYHLAEPLLPAYYAFLADAVCRVFGTFDAGVSCHDNYLLYEGARRLVIVEGCDGVTFVVLILAAVLPFPAPWMSKLIGVFLLTAVLLIVNWLRLVILAAIQFYLPDSFEFVHVYLFQPAMIGFTLFAFLIWTMSLKQSAEPTPE